MPKRFEHFSYYELYILDDALRVALDHPVAGRLHDLVMADEKEIRMMRGEINDAEKEIENEWREKSR